MTHDAHATIPSKPNLLVSWPAFVATLVILTLIWLLIRIADLEAASATLEKRLPNIQTSQNVLEARASVLEDGLARVAAVADNANLYAHSHNMFSDARLKTSVYPLANVIDRVMRLRAISYEWNSAGRALTQEEGLHIGFLAQDIETVFPELVNTDPSGYKTVDYSRLTPVLVAALQAQQARIEQLEHRIVLLEHN